MKLVKSLALATLVASVVSAQEQPNQAAWAKHVQNAKARSRAYVDSGALDARKQAVQDRVGSNQHRALEEEDEEVNRHLQAMEGSIVPNGRFRTGTKGVRENAKLRRKRLYSDGLWLIGRHVYRDYPHLMAGDEEAEEYLEDEAYEADGEETEEAAAATPGQRALYSSPNFDARKETYQGRADAHVSNAKNRAEMSKENAKSSGWYPTQEGEAEQAPEDGEKEVAATEDQEAEEEAPATNGQRALYSSPNFDARKETYQARADAHVSNAKNRAEMSKENAKSSGWYPTQEGEAEQAPEEAAAPAEAEKKEAVAEEGSDLSQAAEMAGYDIADPTTKMTYVGKGAAYAVNGVGRAVSRGATVAEREVDFAADRAELTYKNKQDNTKKSKLRGRKA